MRTYQDTRGRDVGVRVEDNGNGSYRWEIQHAITRKNGFWTRNEALAIRDALCDVLGKPS